MYPEIKFHFYLLNRNTHALFLPPLCSYSLSITYKRFTSHQVNPKVNQGKPIQLSSIPLQGKITDLSPSYPKTT